MNSVINVQRISRLACAALLAVFVSHFAYAQGVTPDWVDGAWRDMSYPPDEWYSGFSENTLKAGANVPASLRALERDAQNKMIETIVVRISGASAVRNTSVREQRSGGSQPASAQSVSSVDYRQEIFSSANAEVAKMTVFSYHDVTANRIYAFAAVKRSTLAAYYANMIESGLSEAERSFDLAAQSAALGKKKGAVENLSAAKKRVESIAYYGNLMMAVDPERGLERAQGERASSLLKKIAAAEVEAENIMPVFVTGTESILGAAVNIIVPELQALLNDNDCRIAETQKDAGYILRIDAKVQNSKFDGYFYHSESSVRVVLTNALTGKAEITTTISGPKEGGTDARGASEAAFKSAVPEIWKAVKGKLAAN